MVRPPLEQRRHTVFTPSTEPIAGSVAISALIALIPLVTFFVLLAVIKTKAHWAGLGSLAVAIIVAILGWKMPVAMALNSGVMGMVFGAFPIVWIVVMPFSSTKSPSSPDALKTCAASST